MEHAILQSRNRNYRNCARVEMLYLVSTPDVESALRNVEGNSLSVTMGEATSFCRSSMSSG